MHIIIKYTGEDQNTSCNRMTKIPTDQNTSWPKYLLTIPIRWFLRNSFGMYTIHYVISCLFRFYWVVCPVYLVQRTSMYEYKYSLVIIKVGVDRAVDRAVGRVYDRL